MQQLEGKITGELSSLQERVSTMQAELHTYRDLDTLRLTAEERKKVTANSSLPVKREFFLTTVPESFDNGAAFSKMNGLHFVSSPCLQRLQEEQVSLTQRRDAFGQLLEETSQKHEALKTKLQENETHAQVSRVLVHGEQTESSDPPHHLPSCFVLLCV